MWKIPEHASQKTYKLCSNAQLKHMIPFDLFGIAVSAG